VLKSAHIPYFVACHLQIDADPDPAYHFDWNEDPTFQFDADPDPQHCGCFISTVETQVSVFKGQALVSTCHLRSNLFVRLLTSAFWYSELT
jgi:hypothetical protein